MSAPARGVKGIVGPALSVLAGSSVALLGSLLTRALLARALAPEELGPLLVAVAVVSAVGGVAGLGLNTAVAGRIAFRHSSGEPGPARASARTALALALAGGLASALAVGLGADWIAAPLSRGKEEAALLARDLVALSLVVLALALGLAMLGISRGFGQVRGRAVVRDAGGGVLRALAVAAGVALGGSSMVLAWAYAAGVATAEGLFVLHGTLQGWLRRVQGSLRWDRRLAATLPPFVGLEALNQVSQWLDLFLLSALAPAAVVGYYGVARGVSRALLMILASGAHAFLPAAAVAGGEEHQELYRSTRLFVLALLWPALAVCLLAPEGPVLLLAGTAYQASFSLLRLLGVSILVEALFAYKDQSLLARGGERAVVVWKLISLVAGAGFIGWLVPLWGGAGAAVGVAAQAAVRGLGLSWALRRRSGIRTRRHDLPPALRWALAALVGGGLAVGLGGGWIEHLAVALVAGGAGSAVLLKGSGAGRLLAISRWERRAR